MSKQDLRYGGVIDTLSVPVDLLDPTPDMISIHDIATSLGNQCRFVGHVGRFYSVAQHSVFVSAMVPPELQKYALMHDASEAYLHDLSAPIKEIWGPAYKVLEDRFMKVVALCFDLDHNLFKEVKQYDEKAFTIEQAAFQHGKMHEWNAECLAIGMPSTVYGPEHSGALFMSSFYKIFGSAYIK